MNKMRRKHDHEEHIDESWLIPYADLLTLLLALFIVLFASSQVDQKKFEELRKSFQAALSGGPGFFAYATPVPNTAEAGINRKADEKEEKVSLEDKLRQEETENLLDLQRQIDQYVEDNGLTNKLETQLDQRQLKITVSDNTLFASGSAELKPESRELAGTISVLLGQYPEYEVVVAGHTDNVPIKTAEFPSNFYLSSERALAFLEILIHNPRIGANRLSSVGYGEYKPVATNETPEGRAKNRRVELSIVRNIK